VATPKHK
jgi:hypothetical protein